MSLEQDKTIIHEDLTSKEIQYPYGYFEAQVRFALKWAELSGLPLIEVLKSKTSLYRRLTDKKSGQAEHLWEEALQTISDIDEPEEITGRLYVYYLQRPWHVYKPPSYPENDGKHFTYFAFDYYPADPATNQGNRIKIHFLNRSRGSQSSLASSELEARKADLKRMFGHIKEHYPDVEYVIGGSWLYAIPSYRESFPPAFTQYMKRLVPPEFSHIEDSVPTMVFSGDSLWGQFVSRTGDTRENALQKFSEKLKIATTLEELLDSFPDKPQQPKAPIGVFYDWIDTN